MDKLNNKLSFTAIRIVQPLGEFFISSIPAKLLLDVTYSDPLRICSIDEDGYHFQGHQRKLVLNRLKSIGEYIDTIEASFPNSIILAANYNEDGTLELNEDKRWMIKETNDKDIVKLLIPQQNKLAAIVDGQHRLFGFNYCNEENRLEMPLLCSIFIDLPHPYQAYLFATINYNQKPVSKSQSYELYGYNLDEESPESWSPEKVAVFICRKLNNEKDSPFYKHIIVTAQTSGNEVNRIIDWKVSTATIVEGLLGLFSNKPKKDRDILYKHEIGEGRSRTILDKDNTPLRDYYIKGNDLLIYTITKNYFNAVSKLLWEIKNNSYIKKTVGIQSLFDILKKLCPDILKEKKVSEIYFSTILEPCGKIDFTDNFFQASGTGRQRIRTSLELCLNLKKISEVKQEYKKDYMRICRLKDS